MTGYAAGMVTRIHRGARRRLFLREHRQAKKISAETMAGRLGIERESVYRLERETWRVNPEKQAAYAAVPQGWTQGTRPASSSPMILAVISS